MLIIVVHVRHALLNWPVDCTDSCRQECPSQGWYSTCKMCQPGFLSGNPPPPPKISNPDPPKWRNVAHYSISPPPPKTLHVCSVLPPFVISSAINLGANSTKLALTYLSACTSAMLLKMTSRLRGSIPASSGSPVIVYVLPELVIP